MENDTLKNAALFYQTIEGKKYRITIKRKQEIQDLTIYFPTDTFLHLAGLHKLKDIPTVQRSAKTVYREILYGKITYQDIAKSKYIGEINDRLLYFTQIHSILETDSLYFKSLHGTFKGIKASFVLTKEIVSDKFGFLFFSEGNPDHCPCSFFIRNDQNVYTKDGTRWKILDLSEINSNNP